MSLCIPPTLGTRFTSILRTYAQDEGLPFASVLTEEQIQRVANEEGVAFGSGPNVTYTPAITLWAFVSQVLSGLRRRCGAGDRLTHRDGSTAVLLGHGCLLQSPRKAAREISQAADLRSRRRARRPGAGSLALAQSPHAAP